jgi:carboxymethylenebutenolidase
MSDSVQYNEEVWSLFDGYVHGKVSRREFLDRAAACSAAGVSATAILASLSPNYATAAQVSPDDKSITVSYQDYDSPAGAGDMRGYLAVPADRPGKVPGVVVIHENRGLNPYVEDVARRVAKAGFIGFAPDALWPLGGYPGNDDDGRTMQRQRDRSEMIEDFVAAVRYLQGHEKCTGKVGCVGFCFGGSVSNALAVRVPDLGAAVPFYGGQPDAEDVPKITAPLMIHYAGDDERVNAGWPVYQKALEAADKSYQQFTYPGARHGFHNDSTPRYDKEAAELAWRRSIEFFEENLV